MEQVQTGKLQIKGIHEGLLINVGIGEWQEIKNLLIWQIRENEKFFHGAKLALDMGSRNVSASELGKLRDELSTHHVWLWAVLSTSPSTLQIAQDLGLLTRIKPLKPLRNQNEPALCESGDHALFLNKTIRSGVRIQTLGNVVVIGDVNPGGEIIAGGSIVVWGRCRGMVQAGSQGALDAQVCALELAPTQLRIGEIIAALPKRKGKPQPEIAFLRDAQVVTESWNPKTR